MSRKGLECMVMYHMQLVKHLLEHVVVLLNEKKDRDLEFAKAEISQ